MNQFFRTVFIPLFWGLHTVVSGVGSFTGSGLGRPNAEVLPQIEHNIGDSLMLTDSVKTILKEVDSLMSDSLSKLVIENEMPFVPAKGSMLLPDIKHFVEHSSVYDFKYINSQLTQEQKLKIRYESILKSNEKLHYNHFRYMPWNKGLVLNYFALRYSTYEDYSLPDLSYVQQLLAHTDTLPDDTLHSVLPQIEYSIGDSLMLTDSVKTILKEVDSLMSDSLSQLVIENDKPFVPAKGSMLLPDIKHFVEHSSVYDFKYINSQLTQEQKLKIKYESILKSDEKLYYNHFRYMPWNKGLTINYFALQYLTYDDYSLPDLTYTQHLLARTDTLPDDLLYSVFSSNVENEYKVWSNARYDISFKTPQKIDLHWDKLPDPPQISDTIYLPTISRVKLDYKNLTGDERSYVRKLKENNKVESPWRIVGYSALQANETYIQNWAKGGESSVSVLGIGRLEADYVVDGLKWENDFELKLGAFMQFGEQADKEVHKNDDRLKISSKVGYKAFKTWFYTANFDFETQLFDGFDLQKNNFDVPISAFLSPAVTHLSLGMDYKYNKNLLSVFISPLTFKNTLVADTSRINEQRYNIKEGKKSKSEAGAYLKAALKWKINTDMQVQSKLYLFSNYIENPQNVDVDWEGDFEYRFSHVFSLRFSVNLKYDDDEKIFLREDNNGDKVFGKRLQVKQLLSVGLSYRF